jgi:hypothetical protein
MARPKPILCVDFDGVIHSYTSGWQGALIIADPPTPGALRWLWAATEWFDVQIYSSRSKERGAIEAMLKWMRDNGEQEFNDSCHPMAYGSTEYPITFAREKPAAFLTIDDRALTFEGDWSNFGESPADLLDFKPWNKRPRSQAASGSIIDGVARGEGLQSAGRELNALEIGAEVRRLGLMGSYEN